MGAVDLIVLAVLGLVALIGWHQGLVRSVLTVVGTVGGGLVAAALLPTILDAAGFLGPGAAALSVGVVLLGVGLGNVLALTIGRPLWTRLQVGAGRTVDAAAGALVSLFAGLMVMWLLAATIASMPSPALSSAVRHSSLLRQVDRWMPAEATQLAYSMRDLLDQVRLPSVFFGLEGLPGKAVPPPPKDISPAAVSASSSVVRISGPTPTCGQGSTGSGFVFAPDHIATNAHVVAGMPQPRVIGSDGQWWGADVVYFNPDIDVAVLFVPGLGLSPLEPSRSVAEGQATVIAGYPGGGPLSLRSARVVARTDESPVFSDNIYGDPAEPREIFVLRGTVIPGNSGGPLLTRDGRYAGVIFANSQQYRKTGFALTNRSVGTALNRASDRTIPVSVGQCAR